MDANSNKGLLFQRRNSGSRLVDSRGEKGELIDRLRIRIRLSRPARPTSRRRTAFAMSETHKSVDRAEREGGWISWSLRSVKSFAVTLTQIGMIEA